MYDKPMKNIESLYILERPIITDIGILYPFTVKEYPEFMEFIGIILLDKRDIIISLKKMISDNDQLQYLLNLIKDLTLFDIIMLGKKGIFFKEIYDQYKKLFQYCFREDVFDKIKTNEEFEYYMNLIRKFNAVDYEKPHPNPEIERRNIIKRLLQKNKGEAITFEAMATSIEAVEGRDVGDMTLYKFTKMFERIAQFKNYDTTTMYHMLSNDVKIEPWYKTIVKNEDQYSYITEEQLQKAKKQGRLQQKL